MTSLASLPYLVLLEIGRSLCAHCNPPDDLIPHRIRFAPHRVCMPLRPPFSSNGEWICTSALRDLSMTCRMLYDIVNPILYHRPYLNDAEHGRYIDLARTLCERVDLAKQFCRLRMRRTCHWPGARRDGDGDGDGDEDSEDTRGGSPVTGGGGQISTGSKLEVLMLESSFGYNTTKAGRFCAPGSLPKLKELYLALHEFRWGFNLDIAMPIFEAAPNLEKIGAWMLSAAGGFGDYHGISWDFDHPDYLAAWTVFPLQNVRELDIQNSVLGDHELFWLLRACPRLEVFNLSETRIRLHDTVTRLSGEATPFLEELRIDGPVLAVKPRTRADGAWKDGTSIFHSLDFVALLPTSIRRFEIIANYSRPPQSRRADFSAWFKRADLFYPELVRLAEAARAGMFPNLAVVKAGWKLTDEERDSLEGKFKLAGVKFLARNEQFHWVGRWD
ncbi:hypothetical protein QBC37DRAFT_487951 [Rhypophila decipiens]|uniref:Uncharacterized protein n=1 Tax=Rhypophila decipiens TaxID=261697 RepID=A0AAN7B1E9_9PEZI|nr:hypothetical protein QBC37DRAFT_487951 [Rhypophila decipiens]